MYTDGVDTVVVGGRDTRLPTITRYIARPIPSSPIGMQFTGIQAYSIYRPIPTYVKPAWGKIFYKLRIYHVVATADGIAPGGGGDPGTGTSNVWVKVDGAWKAGLMT